MSSANFDEDFSKTLEENLTAIMNLFSEAGKGFPKIDLSFSEGTGQTRPRAIRALSYKMEYIRSVETKLFEGDTKIVLASSSYTLEL